MSSELLFFNGVNASTGDYLIPPLAPQDISALARGETFDPAHLQELRWRYQQATTAQFGVKAGVDPKNLAEAGWGVIFAFGADPAIREALSELLDYRREQASQQNPRRYQEYTAAQAYRPGESKNQWLTRQGAGPGPVDPDVVPYYLLIVGEPESIPYAFQAELDVAYAVGRIAFDTLAEYAQYARSVVAAEKNGFMLPRRAAFFGVANPDDPATNLSAAQLIQPLADLMTKEQPNWTVQRHLKDDATKARLTALLGGAETPALFFSASHGIGFNNGDPLQLAHQGSLLCQDWPGPRAGLPTIPPNYYFGADDVADNAQLLGTITFHFACYGAGTPHLDEFAHVKQGKRERQAIAPRSFLAQLPKRLLGHPKGGALAVVGHAERAWGTSFIWSGAGRQLAVFESAFKQLMDGDPIGFAMETFNERYAELSTSLSAELYEIQFGKTPNDLELSTLWTANNDARGYMVVGDPAVRLHVGDTDATQIERPSITVVTPRPAPVEDQPPPAASTSSATGPVSRVSETSPAGLSPTPPSGAVASSTPSATFPVAGDGTVDGTNAFGIVDTMKDLPGQLNHAIQQFLYKVGVVLEHTMRDVSSLEVRTYVSNNMDEVKYDQAARTFSGAQLRAVTLIKVDGDTLVCVPEEQHAIDEALWTVHTDMVMRAQANRAEMIKTAVSAAASLLEAVKTT